MGPGRWRKAISQDRAMAAAFRLQRDVCLMKTNLDILDQYALSLQSTASKMIERSLEASDFPSAEMAAGALGPRVRRALLFKWRLYGCGGPRWTLYGYIRMAGSGLFGLP